jgi:4-diphosphocytidyl-2-C-methyl-D-erythritol kinase
MTSDSERPWSGKKTGEELLFFLDFYTHSCTLTHEMGGKIVAQYGFSGAKIYVIPSFAKVNLRLVVHRKRKDGYHDITSVITRISLKDDLEVKPLLEGITVSCTGEKVPEGANNLAFQAAQLFLDVSGKQGGAAIKLVKRIPSSAGLGGGSSNAAGVLLGLNEIFQRPFNKQELIKLGSRLGMDVPFFIFGGPALARGRGERLSRVKNMPSLYFLVAVPPFAVPTSQVYAQWDSNGKGSKSEIMLTDLHHSLAKVSVCLENDLERITAGWHPEIIAVKERLISLGARGALMSGSGGAVFGVFPDKNRSAEAAARLLLPPGWRCFLAHIV